MSKSENIQKKQISPVNKKKKHLFGRNLFTLLFVLITLLVIAIIVFPITTYSKAYNENKLTPFVNRTATEEFTEGTYNIENVKRMHNSKFKELGIIFNCTSFVQEAGNKSAAYELRVYKNENSKNITGSITANICLSADWVGYIGYGTKTTSLRVADDKEKAESSTTYRRSFTVSNLIEFPAKAKTWPVNVVVSEPTIYLYISYNYQENGKTKQETFILKYDYSELIPQSGGIKK